MAAPGPDDPLLSALRRHFGHHDFREGQREVVESVLAGDDVVLVIPTGGGKSLCYQLPAVLDDRPTLVVSPLIALMKDQIDALRARGIAASALHSNLASSAQRTIESAYRSGLVRLLYVAPERLVRSDVRAMLQQRPPSRVVVDEAHCISEWGHDFRRDYLRIGEVAAELAPLQIVACTATATAEVRRDIAGRLGQRTPNTFVHGFARPNLFLAVERVPDEATKLARLDELVDPQDGHAIVYAGTRARAAALATRLGRRLPTMLYHAELTAEERVVAQERFRRGEVRVAVTTSAFGMGVDIPTVRQVIHAALPSSLEEYYQQAGRAGRDGLPATCLIVYTAADRRLPEFFIEAANPEPATVIGVYRSLHALGVDPGAWRLVAPRHPSAESVSEAGGDAVRDLLRDAGVIDQYGGISAVDPGRLPVDYRRIAQHRRLAFGRLQILLTYVAGRRCRHRLITEHFGEQGVADTCVDRCDVCASRSHTAEHDAVPIDVETVRRVVSTVARLNGRIGISRLAGVLVGSRSRPVAALLATTDVPSYGALTGWREGDVTELLHRLADVGAVVQSPPPYPTVSLTALGVDVMRGRTVVAISDPRPGRPAALPHSRRPSATAAAGSPHLDTAATERFAALRRWRSDQAREREIPAYVVFPDRTLLELAARAPATIDGLAAVPGVGPTKLALYAADLLRLLAPRAESPP